MHEYWTENEKWKELFSMNFKRVTMQHFCQLSVKFWVFCQLTVIFWLFISCHLAPSRTSNICPKRIWIVSLSENCLLLGTDNVQGMITWMRPFHTPSDIRAYFCTKWRLLFIHVVDYFSFSFPPYNLNVRLFALLELLGCPICNLFLKNSGRCLSAQSFSNMLTKSEQAIVV